MPFSFVTIRNRVLILMGCFLPVWHICIFRKFSRNVIWYSVDRMLRVDFYPKQYNKPFLQNYDFLSNLPWPVALPLTLLLSWPTDDWGRVRNLPTNEDLMHWLVQSLVAIGLVTVETDSFRKDVSFSLCFYKTLSLTFFSESPLNFPFFPLGANTKF